MPKLGSVVRALGTFACVTLLLLCSKDDDIISRWKCTSTELAQQVSRLSSRSSCGGSLRRAARASAFFGSPCLHAPHDIHSHVLNLIQRKKDGLQCRCRVCHRRHGADGVLGRRSEVRLASGATSVSSQLIQKRKQICR